MPVLCITVNDTTQWLSTRNSGQMYLLGNIKVFFPDDRDNKILYYNTFFDVKIDVFFTSGAMSLTRRISNVFCCCF